MLYLIAMLGFLTEVLLFGIKNYHHFSPNMGTTIKKDWLNQTKKIDNKYQPLTYKMVPPARIELAIDPYHGSVIPLN